MTNFGRKMRIGGRVLMMQFVHLFDASNRLMACIK